MESELLWLGITLCILLTMSGIISASETALTAVSLPRMFSLSKQGNKKADRVLKLLKDPESFMGAVLISNNLINIFASALTTTLFLKLFGEHGVVYATVIVTVLVVIFGEILPKNLAIIRSAGISMTLAPIIMPLVWIWKPLVTVIQGVINICFKMFGIQLRGIVDDEAVIEELRGTIQLSHRTGAVYRDEKDRLGGLLDLRDLNVSDVMIHRKDLVALDLTLPKRDLIQEMLRTPYTRIPLYKENTENIQGVLHAKDLLHELIQSETGLDGIDLEKIMRKPWYIPETTPVTNQLNKFLSRRNHFALVVDEYGVLKGLITLEDILEEIVGDIRDEHDIELPGFRKQPDGSYIVDGKTAIRDINRKTEWSLPDDYCTTIAGLIIHEARTIPDKGQSFNFYGIRFEILEKHRHQITKIRILPPLPIGHKEDDDANII